MPWQDNAEWTNALANNPEIGVGGGRTDDGRRSTEFLFRPGQLVCDSAVWNDPRDPGEAAVRDGLVNAGARETRSDQRMERDDERAAAAELLDLTLLNVDGDPLALAREARNTVPDIVGLNHVIVAGPQRFGGDAPPVSVVPPTVQIPGAGPASQGPAKTVAVLDTGIVDNAPFPVEPGSDLEPTGVGGFAEKHGTMVAGVIARFAPAAKILVKQVLRLPLGEADELEVVAALDALPHGIDVINASFGGPAADNIRMLALRRALDRLPPTTLVVASAGNEGLNRPHYMAAFKRVVGVGSAAIVGNGPEVCFYSNRGGWVDVCTQGSDVETIAGPGEGFSTCGTSYAAPKIAATIINEADRQSIGVRHAASWLIHESGGPVLAGGGTFVDIPTP
jgi:hypothetical protein